MKKRAALVVVASLLLSLAASFYTLKLFNRLNPDLTSLLSADSRYLKDLNEARERIHSFEGIIILSFSRNGNQNKVFQEALAKALVNNLDPNQYKVKYEVKEEIKFFSARKGLYLTPEEIKELESHLTATLDRRAESKKTKLNFPDLFKTIKATADIIKIKNRYSSLLDRFIRFPNGLFATPDYSVTATIVQRTTPSFGFQASLESLAATQRVVNSVQSNPDFSGVAVRYTGEIPSLIEDQVSITSDIHRSSVIVGLLIFVLLFLFFRRIRYIFALAFSVAVAILVTFAITWFRFHSLNANSAFMGSIVIGNGINFGIMILGHYSESKESSMIDSLKASFAGTTMAAFAAFVAYTVVAFTDFRGFHQFGFVGAVGTLCCWLASFTILPAWITLFPGRTNTQEVKASQTALNISSKTRKAAMIAVICSVIVSVVAIVLNSSKILESDLRQVRDKKSAESGAIAAFKYADLIFGRALSSPMILTTDRKKANQLAIALRGTASDDTRTSIVSSAIAFDDLIPQNQTERAKALRSLQQVLTSKNSKHLTASEKNLITELTISAKYAGFTEANIPNSVKKIFSETNGDLGKIVLVDSKRLLSGADLKGYTELSVVLKEKIAAIDPPALLIGTTVFTSEISIALVKEIKRSSLWVLIGVILTTILLFRNRRDCSLILGSWALGLIWFVGAATLLKLKINFVNFLAVPITIGLGIDYIANLVRKVDVRSKSSAAVLICSLTTMIGYGSLLFAGNNGLRGFGQLAILGEICCIIAAFFCFTLYARKK